MTSRTPKASPSLSQSMNRVARALARHGDAALTPLGLRFAQIPVFALLKRRTGMTQKALAEATGIEQSSMAQLLARMERDGLIVYQPHPTDARSRTIVLTDPDDPRIGEGRNRLTDLERRAVAGLSEEEVETLTALLARVLENLER
ncbi:MarR family winged helix-turn-helix transcriptional regulator [Jidongwangia harbinensis]|uniref:MarR family winged helix-turn-helix transcriptional regulator n=1 Tax=Jidongwangia harbinensis TaxID=2878561 RepID=UPI001CDA0E52|nr:MarR family winged helix-turn-helix transcriptional regulator [Jidongwangia harbinensis]MCA2215519.1 MarR family winged helix-turn-helix transcriptional regulator [Jidongwangia harbinensis]